MIYISPTTIKNDPGYAFTVGKIRVLEMHLLNNQQLNRLLETKDAAALWSELAGCNDYESHLGHVNDPHDFEQVLAAEQSRVYGLMKALAPKSLLLDLLVLRHDFHNCKVLSKARFLDEDPSIALSPLGRYPVKEWEQLLDEEISPEESELPGELQKLARDTQLSLAEETDLRLRDIAWDQMAYGYLFERIRALKRPFALAWLQLRIDCANIMTFLRSYVQKVHKRVLERSLLENGLVEQERFLASFEDGPDGLASRLASGPYADIVQEGLTHYQREKSFSHWEKLTDDFEIEYLKQARMVAMGVEPLFAYLLAKENEVKVLRIILIGKLNQLGKEEITKRVRKLYA